MEFWKIGWIFAGILIIGSLYFITFVAIDCEDGGFPVLNEDECSLYWCSSLNHRVLFKQDCPLSICSDGKQVTNLFVCESYSCPDGSKVNAPEECNKFVCADGNKIDDPKKCVEYCKAPSECNPDKAELKDCFGEWSCVNNACAWQCEENFTSNTAKEIAIPLEVLVEKGYSQIKEEKEASVENGSVYINFYENLREKIKFNQTITVMNKGLKKIELAENFNKAVNETLKLEVEEFEKIELGEDSFTFKNPNENKYGLIFRKANVFIILTIEAETDEKAIELMEKYGKQIESRIN